MTRRRIISPYDDVRHNENIEIPVSTCGSQEVQVPFMDSTIKCTAAGDNQLCSPHGNQYSDFISFAKTNSDTDEEPDAF
jgi:hypothetical protein